MSSWRDSDARVLRAKARGFLPGLSYPALLLAWALAFSPLRGS